MLTPIEAGASSVPNLDLKLLSQKWVSSLPFISYSIFLSWSFHYGLAMTTFLALPVPWVLLINPTVFFYIYLGIREMPPAYMLPHTCSSLRLPQTCNLMAQTPNFLFVSSLASNPQANAIG